MQIITGEPRRRRSDAEKLEILAEAEALGSVSKAARLHGISQSMVFLWRKQFRDGVLKADVPGAIFMPVHVTADAAPMMRPASAPPFSASSEPGMISVMIGAGITMSVPSDAEPSLAAAIAKALAPFAAGRA